MNWQLSDAKAKFSEVVRLALSEGPQRITRHKDAVVVLSEKDYARLTGEQKTLIDHLLDGPSLEGLDLERDRTPLREISL